MNSHSQEQFDAFFASFSSWRKAYVRARLHYFAVRTSWGLSIVSARILLDLGGTDATKPSFCAESLEAGQWEIDQSAQSVEDVVRALVSEEGLIVDGIGRLRLVADERHEVFAGPPILLHPEGLSAGNRLAVFQLSGVNWGDLIRQPDADWLLKAAKKPYESVQELLGEYGLGALRGDRAIIEVVALTSVQVLARSRVEGTVAELGIWMGGALDRGTARLGYRILENGQVVQRDSVSGSELSWQEEGVAAVGIVHLQVPRGAVVQCIASYDGHAHQVQWRADPATHLNPRGAVLALVDPRREILRAFLQPEQPLKGKAADDFEAGIAWLLWTLGFSTAAFGSNAKTKDAFDTVAVSPSGDFVVVECTLGLLKAESKLSRLSERASRVRDSLAASNMKHLRVLPVIVSALPMEQVRVDVPSAEENGILVLTRESLSSALEVEMFRFPDADALFKKGLSQAEERREARAAAHQTRR